MGMYLQAKLSHEKVAYLVAFIASMSKKLPKNNNLGKYHKINQNGLFWYFSQLDTKHSILGKRITEQMYKNFTVYFLFCAKFM